jgi:hypothetical protein
MSHPSGRLIGPVCQYRDWPANSEQLTSQWLALICGPSDSVPPSLSPSVHPL